MSYIFLLFYFRLFLALNQKQFKCLVQVDYYFHDLCHEVPDNYVVRGSCGPMDDQWMQLYLFTKNKTSCVRMSLPLCSPYFSHPKRKERLKIRQQLFQRQIRTTPRSLAKISETGMPRCKVGVALNWTELNANNYATATHLLVLNTRLKISNEKVQGCLVLYANTVAPGKEKHCYEWMWRKRLKTTSFIGRSCSQCYSTFQLYIS